MQEKLGQRTIDNGQQTLLVTKGSSLIAHSLMLI